MTDAQCIAMMVTIDRPHRRADEPEMLRHEAARQTLELAKQAAAASEMTPHAPYDLPTVLRLQRRRASVDEIASYMESLSREYVMRFDEAHARGDLVSRDLSSERVRLIDRIICDLRLNQEPAR